MIQTIQSAILLSLLFLSALSAQEYDACQGQEAYEPPNRGVAVVAGERAERSRLFVDLGFFLVGCQRRIRIIDRFFGFIDRSRSQRRIGIVDWLFGFISRIGIRPRPRIITAARGGFSPLSPEFERAAEAGGERHSQAAAEAAGCGVDRTSFVSSRLIATAFILLINHAADHSVRQFFILVVVLILPAGEGVSVRLAIPRDRPGTGLAELLIIGT